MKQSLKMGRRLRFRQWVKGLELAFRSRRSLRARAAHQSAGSTGVVQKNGVASSREAEQSDRWPRLRDVYPATEVHRN